MEARKSLRAVFALAVPLVVAGTLVLASSIASAVPPADKCWNCLMPDGSTTRIKGTDQDMHDFERATGAVCYRYRPNGGNGYTTGR